MGKIFTVSEANRALLFVRPVMQDLQTLVFELSALQKNPEAGLLKEVEQKMQKIKYHFEELKQVGCLCRDPERGGVDFPSFHKNQPVFLCWNLDDSSVKYWHSVKDHDQEKKLIDELFLEANSKISEAVS